MTTFEGTLSPVVDLLGRDPAPWRRHAKCRGVDIEVFFPEHTGPGATPYREAARLCAVCPVKDACLEDARRTHDVQGFRAGLSPRGREAVFAGGGLGVCESCGESFEIRRHGQLYCQRRRCTRDRANENAKRRRAERDRRCSIDGCTSPHSARGWCKHHWQRWRRTGDPLGREGMEGAA